MTVANQVVVPKLGVTMTEGTLSEWYVAEGEIVRHGQLLYRLETDKVENDIEAPVAGKVRRLAEVGQTYAVGTPIAEIESVTADLGARG